MNPTSHYNQLTEAEAERLALLSEELGEVQQAIGKILRHGYESRHPNGGPTNRLALERELGDVLYAGLRMSSAGDIDEKAVTQRTKDKARSVRQYLHHQ
jgi:NTP pyrophosphatase (non-canonical NTP hydrolase)